MEDRDELLKEKCYLLQLINKTWINRGKEFDRNKLIDPGVSYNSAIKRLEQIRKIFPNEN